MVLILKNAEKTVLTIFLKNVLFVFYKSFCIFSTDFKSQFIMSKITQELKT